MNFWTRRTAKIAVMLGLVSMLAIVPAFAQGGGGDDKGGGAGRGPAGSGGPGRGPAITDPKEFAALQAFQQAKGDKKISAANDFLSKYPKSVVAHTVVVQLVTLEYQKQDWPGFFAASDKDLAIDANDASVLALTGWVISRNYQPGQAGPGLDKAEADEKKCLDLLPTLTKPATLTDDQFNQLKAQAASQAHSALGLAYAKENNIDDSVKELQQVTYPDATDIFMLGGGLESQGKHAEANAQFTKCSSMPGQLQGPCTAAAADTAKEK